ncbi:MAG: transglutaminase family protein [Phycisphaerales bacterium]|nr:transglutaminase family protein [Phycisphaerales bacterium]
MSPHPFDLLMQLDEPLIRLDCAALHLARDAYPGLAIECSLRQLDEIAAQVADRRPGLDAPLRYAAMRSVLVEELGFRGNEEDYYDVENSYLNRVLERRLGIPLSLSVVWIEVARRLKWPVAGVGFPCHFLVRFDDPDRFVVADAFRGGESLSLDDCRELLEARQPGLKFSMSMLEPVSTRAVLIRMLTNLRTIHMCAGRWGPAAAVLERLIAADPTNAQHPQELAMVYRRSGNLRRAYAALAAFIHRCPRSREFEAVCASLERVESDLAGMN